MSYPTDPSAQPLRRVCVTGASSFIGSYIARDLLDKGYFVHATISASDNTPDKLSFLTKHCAADTHLKLFEIDPSIANSYNEPMAGCVAVIHTAVPGSDTKKIVQKQVTQSIVEDTSSVLQSCKSAGVKKVILTSSVGAVLNSDVRFNSNKIYSEHDWNNVATETHLPHQYAHVVAEKVASDFSRENPDIRVVTINPAMVIGPTLNSTLPSSNKVLVDIANGQYRGVLDLSMPIVDVRDVSRAHILAMESASASGRYICASQSKPIHLHDVVRAAKEAGFRPPDGNLTSPILSEVLKLASHYIPGQTSQYFREVMGVQYSLCTKKIKTELNIELTSPEQSLRDSFKDLIKWSHLQLQTSDAVPRQRFRLRRPF